MKNSVVVLTRGYDDMKLYKDLIERNKSILKNLSDVSIDIIIFHEGNINSQHQEYIQTQTPQLKNIIFVNVKEKKQAFRTEKSNLPIYPPTERWGIGYRHMCSFWFCDFFNYLEEYDQVIRIDEDCIIDFSIDELFIQLQEKTIVFGKIIGDHPFVTKGLNEFTLQFINLFSFQMPKNQETSHSKSDIHSAFEMKKGVKTNQLDIYFHKGPKNPYGPYTNVIGMNMNLLRKNEIILNYIQNIQKSNNIYIYRWGDLPLWGEVIHYFLDENDYLLTPKIKYFHGSHSVFVN